jgi:hypothetical protein
MDRWNLQCRTFETTPQKHFIICRSILATDAFLAYFLNRYLMSAGLIVDVCRKMFIGGLNWETTDRRNTHMLS